MKAQTKTILYVLGGLATLVGGGTAIYFATRDAKKPLPPAIPISDTKSSIVEDATPIATQADIQQQQLNQQQQSPPPPPTIQVLQNLSQII